MSDYRHYHKYATVTVGETGVTIEQASGSIVHAGIVHAERDETGRVLYALLDRKVHDEYTGYRDWIMGGCYVTEMTRVRDPAEDREAGRDAYGLARERVEAVLAAAWPDRDDLYGMASDIADRIEQEDTIMGFWSRSVLLDGLVGWIVQTLDAEDLGMLEQLESVAESIVGRCKAVLG